MESIALAAVLSVPVWGVIAYAIIKLKWAISDWDLSDILIVGGLSISSLLIMSAWNIHPYFGIGFTICVYLSAWLINVQIISGTLPEWPWITMSVLTSIGVMVIITVRFLPMLQSDVSLVAVEIVDESIDLSFVDESLNNIRQSLSVSGDVISQEQQKIDDAAKQLISELENRNAKLTLLKDEHRLLMKQVEQYKALASLTERQTEAVVLALERNKYLDYLVGFLIGVMSSGLTSILFRRQLFSSK